MSASRTYTLSLVPETAFEELTATLPTAMLVRAEVTSDVPDFPDAR